MTNFPQAPGKTVSPLQAGAPCTLTNGKKHTLDWILKTTEITQYVRMDWPRVFVGQHVGCANPSALLYPQKNQATELTSVMWHHSHRSTILAVISWSKSPAALSISLAFLWCLRLLCTHPQAAPSRQLLPESNDKHWFFWQHCGWCTYWQQTWNSFCVKD